MLYGLRIKLHTYLFLNTYFFPGFEMYVKVIESRQPPSHVVVEYYRGPWS